MRLGTMEANLVSVVKNASGVISGSHDPAILGI